jgi:hypothetical protein
MRRLRGCARQPHRAPRSVNGRDSGHKRRLLHRADLLAHCKNALFAVAWHVRGGPGSNLFGKALLWAIPAMKG